MTEKLLKMALIANQSLKLDLNIETMTNARKNRIIAYTGRIVMSTSVVSTLFNIESLINIEFPYFSQTFYNSSAVYLLCKYM